MQVKIIHDLYLKVTVQILNLASFRLTSWSLFLPYSFLSLIFFLQVWILLFSLFVVSITRVFTLSLNQYFNRFSCTELSCFPRQVV